MYITYPRRFQFGGMVSKGDGGPGPIPLINPTRPVPMPRGRPTPFPRPTGDVFSGIGDLGMRPMPPTPIGAAPPAMRPMPFSREPPPIPPPPLNFAKGGMARAARVRQILEGKRGKPAAKPYSKAMPFRRMNGPVAQPAGVPEAAPEGDNVPAMLAGSTGPGDPGEFVLNKGAVLNMGLDHLNYQNERGLKNIQPPGPTAGAPVGPAGVAHLQEGTGGGVIRQSPMYNFGQQKWWWENPVYNVNAMTSGDAYRMQGGASASDEEANAQQNLFGGDNRPPPGSPQYLIDPDTGYGPTSTTATGGDDIVRFPMLPPSSGGGGPANPPPPVSNAAPGVGYGSQPAYNPYNSQYMGGFDPRTTSGAYGANTYGQRGGLGSSGWGGGYFGSTTQIQQPLVNGQVVSSSVPAPGGWGGSAWGSGGPTQISALGGGPAIRQVMIDGQPRYTVGGGTLYPRVLTEPGWLPQGGGVGNTIPVSQRTVASGHVPPRHTQ